MYEEHWKAVSTSQLLSGEAPIPQYPISDFVITICR